MDETSICWWKGHRVGQIAAAFYRIKQDVPRDSKDKADLSNIIRVLFKMESLLIDLSDLIRIYPGRVSLVSGFLDVLIPSLEKTMNDIWNHLGHPQPNLEKKWKLIAHNMMSLDMVGSGGSRGPSLHTRLINYERFLLQLQRLLSKPKLLEPSCLRSSLKDLLKLREYQNLDRPYEIPYVPDPSEVKIRQVTDYHWAQRIFDNRIKKTDFMTKLDKDSPSVCYDTSSPSSALEVPPFSTILLKVKFDNNALSIVIYLPFNRPNCPRMLCRWTDDEGYPRHASRGVWELRMLRRGGELRLEGYNDVKKRPELWCSLGFKHWEKMVLFHDTFVVLKATCERTAWCDPNELVLGEETKLFKGRILDDGYEHSLSLYQDKECGAIRLSATSTQGRKLCPAWTAFIPSKDIKKSFAKRTTDHHAVLRSLDMCVYAGANQYCPKKHFTTSGAFLLEFTHSSEAEDFMIAWRVLAKTQEAK